MRMRLGTLTSVAVFVVAFSLSSVALAAEQPNALMKLERGAINVTTGWLELPVLTVRGAAEGSPFLGGFYGFVRGIHRTGLGAWDGITFPFGPYGKPVMEPETVFTPIRY